MFLPFALENFINFQGNTEKSQQCSTASSSSIGRRRPAATRRGGGRGKGYHQEDMEEATITSCSNFRSCRHVKAPSVTQRSKVSVWTVEAAADIHVVTTNAGQSKIWRRTPINPTSSA